jgi:RNA polymerase sigma-70 factor (ECF subfamily)
MREDASPFVQISPSSEVWQRWLAERSESFFLYARQQTRCVADAEDVLQEVLFETWRKAADKPPDAALVFATIRRRAMDLARSTERRAVREDATIDGTAEPFVMPEFGASDTHAQLAEAVRELPDHLREVLTLRIWGGLSFPEIGAVTGVSENTAASRYRYALEQLRETLGKILR